MTRIRNALWNAAIAFVLWTLKFMPASVSDWLHDEKAHAGNEVWNREDLL